jgi:hypothetical protein
MIIDGLCPMRPRSRQVSSGYSYPDDKQPGQRLARIVLSGLDGHSAEASQLFGGLFLPFLRGCSMIASGPGNTRPV